jgi:hypothetical protein
MLLGSFQIREINGHTVGYCRGMIFQKQLQYIFSERYVVIMVTVKEEGRRERKSNGIMLRRKEPRSTESSRSTQISLYPVLVACTFSSGQLSESCLQKSDGSSRVVFCKRRVCEKAIPCGLKRVKQ